MRVPKSKFNISQGKLYSFNEASLKKVKVEGLGYRRKLFTLHTYMPQVGPPLKLFEHPKVSKYQLAFSLHAYQFSTYCSSSIVYLCGIWVQFGQKGLSNPRAFFGDLRSFGAWVVVCSLPKFEVVLVLKLVNYRRVKRQTPLSYFLKKTSHFRTPP
jgi:hypothetical protein